MKWKDLQAGHEFEDGSTVTQLRHPEEFFCYRFWLKNYPKHVKDNYITVSEDHYILCELNIPGNWISYLSTIQPVRIPVSEDIHVYENESGNVVEEQVTNYKPWCFDKIKKQYWLNAKNIFTLLSLFGNRKVKPVGNKFLSWEPVGFKQCFCVSTDTGKYKCCGVINSNSVTLRNIIFHALTHSDDMKLCMIDLKLSEFSRYKGMNNVVGVANTTREAAELLRLCREVMQKRNQQNADRYITDFVDYDPKKPTKKVSIYGREFDEDTMFPVEIGGEKKEMSAKEILEWVKNNYK